MLRNNVAVVSRFKVHGARMQIQEQPSHANICLFVHKSDKEKPVREGGRANTLSPTEDLFRELYTKGGRKDSGVKTARAANPIPLLPFCDPAKRFLITERQEWRCEGAAVKRL